MPQLVIANVKLHIEVPLLLIFFAFVFSDSIRVNLLIFRTCYVTLGYNKSECSLLGSKEVDNNTAELEKVVEPYAAVINMVHSLIEAAFTVTICLFVGPWSDRFGRKPFLIIPVIGHMLFFASMAIFAVLEDLSPWYSLICSIPVCLTGGASSYLTVLLCYISDVTDETNRGMRMGVFEAVLALGIFLGNVSSSYAFAATNYWTIFLISSACCVLSLLFTTTSVPESLPNPETEGHFKSFFQVSNVKDMLTTTFKRRPDSDRCVVLSCLFMLTLYIVMINGDGAVTFLFLREKFNWSLTQYTLYSAAHNIVWILGTVIGIYVLHKVLKITETVMIVIGFTSIFVGMILMGLAKYDWEVYTAAFSRCLGGVLSPMVRSLVSKIVPNEEVGKIFALIVVSESIFGMAGSPMFTGIYNETISMDPAIFNFVGAGFYLLEIVIAVWVMCLRNFAIDRSAYEEIVNEDDERTNEVFA